MLDSYTHLVYSNCSVNSIAVCRLSVLNSISLHPLLCPHPPKWPSERQISGGWMLCVGTIEHPLLGWPASLLLITFHTGPPRPAHREPRSWEHTATKRALEGLTLAYREREQGSRECVCVTQALGIWGGNWKHACIVTHRRSVIQACTCSLLLLGTPVSTHVCITQYKGLTKEPLRTFLA